LKDLTTREVYRQLNPGATHINFVVIEQEYYFLVSVYNSTANYGVGCTIYKFEAPGKPFTKVQTIAAAYTATTLLW